jgi:hypothetical protein
MLRGYVRVTAMKYWTYMSMIAECNPGVIVFGMLELSERKNKRKDETSFWTLMIEWSISGRHSCSTREQASRDLPLRLQLSRIFYQLSMLVTRYPIRF